MKALVTRYVLLVLMGILFGFLVSCDVGGTRTPIIPTEMVQVFYTSAAETVFAGLTEMAVEESTQDASSPAGRLSTPTLLPTRTHTPEPSPETPTALPSATNTVTPTIEAPPTDTQSPATSPTATPLPIPANTATGVLLALPQGEVVFRDDFEASQGWFTGQEEGFRFEYADGTYQVFNNLSEASVRSVISLSYADVFLEVDAAPVDGPDNGYFGPICRYTDGSNFYAMVLGADGFYGIIRIENGVLSVLVSDTTETTQAFQESGENRIGASCIGNRLALYVNNQPLLEVQDDTFASGKVGLLVRTRQEIGVLVRFDNFQVLVPEP